MSDDTVTEYAVRVSADPGRGFVILEPTFDKAEAEAALARYRKSWASAVLMVREVRRSAWHQQPDGEDRDDR